MFDIFQNCNNVKLNYWFYLLYYCVLAIQVVFQDGSVFITISFIKISSLLDLSLAHLAKGKVNFCPDLASVVC